MSQFRSDVVEPLPSVEGALSFIVPQDTKPVFHSTALTGGEAKIFFELEDVSVPIADMRLIAENLSVDTQGFELLHHETQVDDLYDDEAVDSTYHAEVEDILRERFDAM